MLQEDIMYALDEDDARKELGLGLDAADGYASYLFDDDGKPSQLLIEAFKSFPDDWRSFARGLMEQARQQVGTNPGQMEVSV